MLLIIDKISLKGGSVSIKINYIIMKVFHINDDLFPNGKDGAKTAAKDSVGDGCKNFDEKKEVQGDGAKKQIVRSENPPGYKVIL